MKHVTLSVLIAGALAATSCGDNGNAPEGAAAVQATPASAGLISQQTIDGCAGFTREKAAALLGLGAAIVTDYSRTEGPLRHCVYRQSDRNTGIVSFTLMRKASVDEAKTTMASEREAIGMAQRAIDGVTGSKTKEAAVQDAPDVGDEAFFSPVNETIMLRVGNVIAQVSGPQDLALKRRAAREVAQGLRQ